MSQDFSIKQSKWNTKAANKRPKSLIKYFFLPMTGVDPMTVSRQKINNISLIVLIIHLSVNKKSDLLRVMAGQTCFSSKILITAKGYYFQTKTHSLINTRLF